MNGIRKCFLDFFKKNGHEIYNSSPIIPYNDNSLLFVNAGMVPFKDFFLNKRKPDHSNIASSQLCIRAGGKHNDLENVGFTKRHHTLFEMLGNFSFGDYFKEKAIFFAWNFLTKEIQLNKDKLYITVYHNDEEAFNLWKKISGFSDDKIIKISTEDNFWQMGETGPCGPCSEIYYDHGDHLPGLLPDKGDTKERFVEIWNLVFMQMNKASDGSLIALPEKCIDTGMGLERISAIIEGTDDNYEIEIFKLLTQFIGETAKNHSYQFACRIIADHLRSSSFLIAEGIMPSNQGRGYVLRKIIRRASRYAYMLGNLPILSKIFPILRDYMCDVYPQIKRAESLILSILDHEEGSFGATLKRGIDLLNEFSEKIENSSLSGEKAFMLYDTYGFPLEITKEILAEKNIIVDEKGFDVCMDAQKDRAKKSWTGSGETLIDDEILMIYENYGNTDFVGYKEKKIKSNIIGIIKHRYDQKKAFIILSRSPFYGESGGQEGDKGKIYSDEFHHELNIEVIKTKKIFDGLHLHECIIHSGKPEIGAEIWAEIDHKSRSAIEAAHSATHMLHHALRSIIGKHVTQKGSLVTEDKLRFDFNHTNALSSEEIITIETLVNKMIWDNVAVMTDIKNITKAFEEGAIGLFGEKYDDIVRMVVIGDSKELCCGTHVKHSGNIGFFKIINECSIASGVRRIEALTRFKALEFIQKNEIEKQKVIMELNKKIIEEQKKNEQKSFNLHKKIAELAKKDQEEFLDIQYLTQILYEIPPESVRRIIVEYKNFIKSGIIVIASSYEEKEILIIGITNTLINKISAIELINISCELMQLKNGGGKVDVAQSSCKFDKLKDVFALIKDYIIKKLS